MGVHGPSMMGVGLLILVAGLAVLGYSLVGQRVREVVGAATKRTGRTAVLFSVLFCVSLYVVMAASTFLGTLKPRVVVEHVVLRSGASGDAYKGSYYVGKREGSFVLVSHPGTASQRVHLLLDSEVSSIEFREGR